VGSTYTGIDLGGELLTNAKQLFENAPFQTKFIKEDVLDFTPTKKYDIIKIT
jgi:2-polyprenyl-3-methyl-5-hydroxy-6-metoxy-1,4-benzoquinol methylase